MSPGSMTTGWWYTYPSEKHEFVNGKDDIPYIVENNKVVGGFNPSETTHQGEPKDPKTDVLCRVRPYLGVYSLV